MQMTDCSGSSRYRSVWRVFLADMTDVAWCGICRCMCTCVVSVAASVPVPVYQRCQCHTYNGPCLTSGSPGRGREPDCDSSHWADSSQTGGKEGMVCLWSRPIICCSSSVSCVQLCATLKLLYYVKVLQVHYKGKKVLLV